jgi:WD40 repeat protein
VKGVSFSADGKLIATASADNTVKLWSLEGKELQTLRGHLDGINSVIFSPDGKMIATGSTDKTVKLWNLEGKKLHTFRGHLILMELRALVSVPTAR